MMGSNLDQRCFFITTLPNTILSQHLEFCWSPNAHRSLLLMYLKSESLADFSICFRLKQKGVYFLSAKRSLQTSFCSTYFLTQPTSLSVSYLILWACILVKVFFLEISFWSKIFRYCAQRTKFHIGQTYIINDGRS